MNEGRVRKVNDVQVRRVQTQVPRQRHPPTWLGSHVRDIFDVEYQTPVQVHHAKMRQSQTHDVLHARHVGQFFGVVFLYERVHIVYNTYPFFCFFLPLCEFCSRSCMFLPSVQGNACWSEGVIDFYAHIRTLGCVR